MIKHIKKINFEIRNEWKNLFKNKILLGSMIVIMFIPIMYGGFFLGSIWNPYGKTQNMPVAFVNNDKGATLQGKSINIGEEAENTLKKNEDLKWEFVDSTKAKEGVNDGYYYAVVSIPENFSENAASITSSSPQKAKIEYTLTPAKNYIGSLITTQAANEIKTNISKQLVEAYVQGIFSSLHELGDGMSQASAGAEELALGSEKLNLGINQYTDGVEKIATNQQTLSGGLTQLENGARQIQAGLKSTGDALPDEAQINQLKNGINSLQHGINILNSSVSNPSNELTTAQKNLKKSSDELISSLSKLEKNGADLQEVLEYASGQITGGGSATLTAEQIGIISSFAKTSSDVAEKSATLLNNLQTFSGLLQKQQETLQQGVSSLQSGANLVLPSTKTALSGYGVLRGANAELLNGSNSLVSGLVTANAGSRQLTNGANTLMQNSAQLKNGSLALNEGASTLSEKLAIAADQVQLQPTGEKTQAQIATPVASLEIEKGNVPNYGYALAPYVLSLGLFVGALVVNVIYPIRKDFSKKGGAVALWASKLSVAFVAAIVQATVLMAIMVWFLGLHPENSVHFVLAIYLTSIANMMIVTFLVIVFDNPGRFLAMLLLVLQLGASGGTFPIQTSPGFFQAINPFLPMTYSILALRQAISGGLPISIFNQSMWILVIISSLAIGALLLYYILQKKNHQQMI